MSNKSFNMFSFSLCIFFVLGHAFSFNNPQNDTVDPRNIFNGQIISNAGGYFDQPYCVKAKGSSVRLINGVPFTTTGKRWLCVITTSNGTEGSDGEHMVSTYSVDEGQTWSPLNDIVPPSRPDASYSSSYGVPIKCPKSNRVYVVYNYNLDNVEYLPSGTKLSRTDMLGHFRLKYTDDGGDTWSTQDWEVPISLALIDQLNDWLGAVKMFWTVDKPHIVGDQVYFGFAKVGSFTLEAASQGYFMMSPNLCLVKNPGDITWITLPQDSEFGIMPPNTNMAEETHMIPISDKQLWSVSRTQVGKLVQAYSFDGGYSWKESSFLAYDNVDTRYLKNPRGPITPRQFSNGKLLMLYYNNGFTTWTNRNVYWLTGGRIVNNTVQWSQPEIALYTLFGDGPGYPDFIEENGSIFVTETNKSVARIHQLDPHMVNLLWNQWNYNDVTNQGLILSTNSSQHVVSVPPLPSFLAGEGMTITMWLQGKDNSSEQILLDNRLPSKDRGFAIFIGEHGLINIFLSDDENTVLLMMDEICSDRLLDGKLHHLAFVIDGLPKIITMIVDNMLCDGGRYALQGWGFFPEKLSDVNGDKFLAIAPTFYGKVHSVKIYNRYLLTTEVIGLYQAGLK